MIGPNEPLSELVQKKELEASMAKLAINGISVGYINGDDVSEMQIGTSDLGLKVQPRTQFAAASLSKPVFAYLVLKLAQAGKIDLDKSLAEMSGKDGAWSKRVQAGGLSQITPRMILEHRTGLPITAPDEGVVNFQFEPGTKYGYSGIGIQCLQEAVEKETKESLEQLAKEYVFNPLKMTNTTFADTNGNHIAANSLRTTASDYTRFIQAWMNDETLMAAFQFDQDFTMKKDPWAVGLQSLSNEAIDQKAIKDSDLERLSWGLGIGLQKNPDGSITAFHSGDMNNWRALVAFNITHKTGVVLFANSPNGLGVAEDITSKTVPLEPGLNYLFQKYGFEREFKAGWQERERARFRMGSDHFPPDKPFPEAPSSPSQSRHAPLLLRHSSPASSSQSTVSVIEQLLHRAKSMHLDPQKLLRNEGVNIEHKDNFAELNRLAQSGDKMAHALYKIAAENIQNRSKLASKQLDAVKNPLQTKNTKE